MRMTAAGRMRSVRQQLLRRGSSSSTNAAASVRFLLTHTHVLTTRFALQIVKAFVVEPSLNGRVVPASRRVITISLGLHQPRL